MNKIKWRNPAMPAHRLVSKLMEEVGEVAKEFNDALDAQTPQDRLNAKLKMTGELEHVLFIADVLRDNVQADIEAGRY